MSALSSLWIFLDLGVDLGTWHSRVKEARQRQLGTLALNHSSASEQTRHFQIVASQMKFCCLN